MTRRTFIAAAIIAILPARLAAEDKWICTSTGYTTYCTNGTQEISAIWGGEPPEKPKWKRCRRWWRRCR